MYSPVAAIRENIGCASTTVHAFGWPWWPRASMVNKHFLDCDRFGCLFDRSDHKDFCNHAFTKVDGSPELMAWVVWLSA